MFGWVLLLFMIVFGTLSGCKGQSVETYGGMTLDKMGSGERLQCEASGGEVYVGGITPTELCALPTTDAGKSCNRASDCNGFCESVTKSCSKSRMGSGCYEFLDNDGKAQTICVD